MYEYEKFGRKVEQETAQAKAMEDMEYQWNKSEETGMEYANKIETFRDNLSMVAGIEYTDNIIELAAQNADCGECDPEEFYEGLYLSLHGILESQNAPESYFDAIP